MIASLEAARVRAREERRRLESTGADLLADLRGRLQDEHGIELVAVSGRAILQGGRAEIVPAEECLYYDRRLDENPEELLEVVAHEYGHLLLHHDGFAPAPEDLIRGSVFLESGASELARYSPRSREEAEASAFAAELICPAAEVFERWRTGGETEASLAGHYHATVSLVRIQLAEGLHGYVTGREASAEPARDEPPTTTEQEAAATALGAPVLVDAGPGTGKTKTLVRRVSFLVQEKAVPPERILVLTFSNEAAAELRERLRRVLGAESASRLNALTFHAFGVSVLHALGHHVGLDVDFSILDEDAQEELLSELLARVDCDVLLDIKDPGRTAAEVIARINYLKDRLVSPELLRREVDGWTPASSEERTARERAGALLSLFEAYEEAKRERHRVDFADLILVTEDLLARHADVRERLQREFPWVLVDEYQDVSRATALLLQRISSTDSPPWVVGDARQAIYRFRGAAPENVLRFREEFPGARIFQLVANFRSSPEVVLVANWLAALLEDPRRTGPVPERWRSAGGVHALGDEPVRLAVATSDAAERDGVVRTVERWLAEGAEPNQIAVLARRNIDVRNVAVDLQRRGVRAVTSGLLTAEGAGGDLAAAVSAVDHQAALARVAYGLWGRRARADVINDAVRQLLLADPGSPAQPEWHGPPEARAIAEDVWDVQTAMRQSMHAEDGWAALCRFLFSLTPYVRRLLSDESDPERSVQLDEVVSALALAATYRFTHPHVSPRRSRLGFAERLRRLVTQAAPGLVPPRPQADAVQVMTCHAAKGLEFPCVAVVGQSIANLPPQQDWLPPRLRRDPVDDRRQADSLLFVGVTRAQRSAVVSYARSASGSPRSRLRQVPETLARLHAEATLPAEDWAAPTSVQATVTIGRVWGGGAPVAVSPYTLSSSACQIRVYLEEELGARFRGRLRPLYPDFVSRVRRTLRRVVAQSLEAGSRVLPAEAARIATEEWPDDVHARHPHLLLYRPRLGRWAQALADALPVGRSLGAVPPAVPLVWSDAAGIDRTLKLDLIAEYEDAAEWTVIALHTGTPTGKGTTLNWSELKDYQRLPFVLLHERYGDVRALVFFGGAGSLRRYQWHDRRPAEAIREQAREARDLFDAQSAGAFRATPNDWLCDRCPSRTICPWWIGAVG